jgi:acyl-CoA reductase-like NAD-dependent aldehyde dehydrogenase
LLDGLKTFELVTEVTDKFTGKIFAGACICVPEDVERAFETASKAPILPGWKRAEILNKASVILEGRQDEFAKLIAIEAGKPIKLARQEVLDSVTALKLSAAATLTLESKMINLESDPKGVNRRAFVRLEPIGTAVCISPFNYPLRLFIHKVAPALAAGCPVIAKPSTVAPLSALAMGEILLEAGLPPPCLAIMIGKGSDIGENIVAHSGCAHLNFTGSSKVGWKLVELNPKVPRMLELGSNSAMIADGSWNPVEVARIAIGSSMDYQGQDCIALQKLYVTSDIFDDVVEKCIELASNLVIGNPLLEETDLGPLISMNAVNRLKAWIKESEFTGAETVFSVFEGGSLVGPQIILHAPESSKIMSREVFGPVLCINRIKSVEEAVERINGSRFQIQTGLLMSDYKKAIQTAEKLQTGTVIIGDAPSYRSDAQPYGGVKESGMGREGPFRAIRDLVTEKLIIFSIN